MLNDRINNCRICGFGLKDPPWGTNGKDPTWEICPCCGVEFGYEDVTSESARLFRNAWIANGAKWFDAGEKPDGWALDTQLLERPDGFRGS